MIEVGKTYSTKSGRKFKIIGKKDISPTGFHYVGECVKVGLVAYFNHMGEHSHQSELWLDADNERFIGIRKDSTLSDTSFKRREEIPADEYIGYLMITNNDIHSLQFSKVV